MVQVLDWLSFAFGGLQLCLKASVVFFLLMRRVGSVLVKKKVRQVLFCFFVFLFSSLQYRFFKGHCVKISFIWILQAIQQEVK